VRHLVHCAVRQRATSQAGALETSSLAAGWYPSGLSSGGGLYPGQSGRRLTGMMTYLIVAQPSMIMAPSLPFVIRAHIDRYDHIDHLIVAQSRPA
jgi:hypothetical protein